jgi:hypothetical protein
VGAVQTAVAVAKYLFFSTRSLQFAMAGSAATLSQQEENNTADVRRGRVNITVIISPAHTLTEGRAPVRGSEF